MLLLVLQQSDGAQHVHIAVTGLPSKRFYLHPRQCYSMLRLLSGLLMIDFGLVCGAGQPNVHALFKADPVRVCLPVERIRGTCIFSFTVVDGQ